MLGALFHELDAKITGCRHPGYLAPNDRLQGTVVIEKCNANIHCHILITCADIIHQAGTAFTLFSLLDTVPDDRNDLRDDEWQRHTWNELVKLGWVKEPARTRTHSPILARWAPAATAMVQLVRTDHDLRRISHYLSKEVRTSSDNLLTSDFKATNDLIVRELRELHSTLGARKPARLYHIDPETNAKVLDLDQPLRWRAGRKFV